MVSHQQIRLSGEKYIFMFTNLLFYKIFLPFKQWTLWRIVTRFNGYTFMIRVILLIKTFSFLKKSQFLKDVQVP